MITKQILNQFIGTTQYYQHPLCKSVIHTDGVQYIYTHGGAWLIDMIASHLVTHPNLDRKCLGQIFFTMTKYEDQSAILVGQKDIGRPNLIHQLIGWTDYPLEEQEIWGTFTVMDHDLGLPDKYGWVLYLPSEY